MRSATLRCAALLLFAFGALTATPAVADTGDPPIATIYDADFNDVETITVLAGGFFILYVL